MRPTPRTPLSHLTANLVEEDILAGKWTEKLPGCRRLREYYHVGNHTMTNALNILTSRNVLMPAVATQARRINGNASESSAPDQANKTLVIVTARERSLEDMTARRIFKDVSAILGNEGWDTHYEPTLEIIGKPGPEIQALIRIHPNSLWLLLTPSSHAVDLFAKNKLQAVCLGSLTPIDKLPLVAILISDVLATCLEHLVSRGHKRISCLLGCECADSIQQCYADTYQRHGLTFLPSYNLPDTNNIKPDALFSLFESIFSITPPTAVIIQTQEILISFLSFCAKHGLRIPDDVSVLLIDNIHNAFWMTPKPTFVDRPVNQYVKYLVNTARGYPHNKPKRKILSPKLIEQDSVKTIR